MEEIEKHGDGLQAFSGNGRIAKSAEYLTI
jgi:hypothetical protein